MHLFLMFVSTVCDLEKITVNNAFVSNICYGTKMALEEEFL